MQVKQTLCERLQQHKSNLLTSEQWPNFTARDSIITSYLRTCWLMEFGWAIAEQQGYLWPTLIGRSMSTNTKRAHTRDTAWSRNWQQFARALFHSCCLRTDSRLCCVTLLLFLALPRIPCTQALHGSSTLPQPLVPLLCNWSWNGKTTAARFQRSPFLCGSHPGSSSLWSH